MHEWIIMWVVFNKIIIYGTVNKLLVMISELLNIYDILFKNRILYYNLIKVLLVKPFI